MSIVRYHINLNKGRTTVSLDKILSELIALKLNGQPGTKAAHRLVRKQLAAFVAHDLGRDGYRLSNYIREKAVLFISDKILSEKYDAYLWEEYDN